MNRSPLRLGFLLMPLALACLALLPQAQAACQEGCLTNDNTVLGDDALLNNTGTDNTAIGFHALYSNTTGQENTANGVEALRSNTTGSENTANGRGALYSNTTGLLNMASGFHALYSNTTGSFNIATGDSALGSNTTGSLNTASGVNALLFNEIGINNTATGYQALLFNTTGNYNIATGDSALSNNTTGSFNIALGSSAGADLTTGSSNIDIGNVGVEGDSRTIRIGTRQTHRATFIAGISGATVPTGVAVIVNANGHLGTTTSSARFKDEIKPMDKASEAILALKPVTFHYKKDLDPDGIPQFGLVAEQVEKVNPDLVARDDDGKPYTVRYEAVNAMLLNEFLKEHRMVTDQGGEIAELEATVAELKSALKEQSAQIRQVSAQLAAGEPSARLVSANK